MNGSPPDDSDWRSETRGDLELARAGLESLSSSVSGPLGRDQVRALWHAYVLVEKSVAFVKVELDEESPGRFVATKQYSIPDERQAITFATRHLLLGTDSFRAGDLKHALLELRECRNYLRMLLKRVRRSSPRSRPGS